MSRLALPAALAGASLGVLAEDGGLLAGQRLVGVVAGGVVVVLGGSLARRRLLVALGLAMLAGAIGAWRGASTSLPTGPGSVASMVSGEPRSISGTLVEEPRPRGERQQVILDEVLIGSSAAEAAPTRGRLLVWLPRAVAASAGERLSFEGRLDAPRDFEGFAYTEYLARQGIGAVSSAFSASVGPGSRGALADGLADLRALLLHGLNAVVPEPEAALGAGILLGARAGIAPEVSDAFATAGLTHVVAISGWNIAIVAAVVGALVRPLVRLRGGRYLAVLAAAIAVGGYVLLTGASPSVVRAALMAAALVLARLGGSRAHAVAALMVAVLAMLMAAPPVLWDVGFQLSALATAGLIWFGAGIEAALGRWPALVREPVALTLAAQLTTLPVILLNFERLSLVSPLANVLVVPLVPIVMLCSALAAVFGALVEAAQLSGLGDLLGWGTGGAAWLYLRLMILAGDLAARVPLASVELSAPGWLAAGWYPFLLILHRRMRTPGAARAEIPMPGLARAARSLPIGIGTLVVLGAVTLTTQPDGRLHVAMLDVGQGDAILVRAPGGATMLVDGGPDPDLLVRRLGEQLPFWQRRIDVILLTHPHEDHVAGLVAALERYRVGLVLEPGRHYQNPTYPRFRDLAVAERGGRLELARAGQRVTLDGGTTLDILFPADADAAAPLPDGDINNASVVALLQHRGVRVLLTGDAEAPVEELLLARGLLGPVDVLKVGHHGSDSSSTPRLLALLQPRWALISTGAGNEYGHPHVSTLAQLAAVPGLRILRTDRDGSVEVTFDGSGIEVMRRGAPDAGSIGPWPSPVSTARSSCSPTSPCRTGSCGIRAGWRGSRPRRRDCCRRLAFRLTRSSSRSPPCCTMWTSRRRAAR